MKFSDKIEHIQTKQTPSVLRFCTLEEQTLLKRMIPDAILDGGYPEAERKRAFLYREPEDNIVAFQIDYDQRFLTLTHAIVLGTLMSLSITRDSIGDILPDQAIFFVTTEIADEIERSLTSFQRVPISLQRIDGSQVERNQRFSNHTAIVSSLRLDLVVSTIARLSRTEAQDLIQNELVQINHQVQAKPTKQITVGDTLSIRKAGRFVIDDANGRTKKGKIVLNYRKYE